MASEKVLYKAEDGTLINLSTKVINNTTTDSTTDALSAAQGKVLASKFTTLTKSSVGLGNVDNTADADKSVKAATKLQTYHDGSTTNTYGDNYPLYAQWDGNIVNLKVDNYKVKTDSATNADNASSADSATYATSAGSVAWDNVSGKPSTFTPVAHTHTKSQITDFPASLKNPTALTIQTNGATAATYDGSAAKSVNITKASIGLGSVDNTADSAKSVKYASSAGSVAWDNVSGKPSTFAPASHTHSKSEVGLGNVDNTADSAKSVKAATKLQTYKGGSTTETYGDSYPLYAQWQSDNTVKLTCDNYKTRTDLADKASTADSATSAGSASSATTASKLGSATVGSASTPIYLNGGTATACTGVMKAPIYSTTDLTPGVSDLADGQIYIVYYN